jgi:hypothetical protein
MLQVYISNVSDVLEVSFNCFHTDVTYVAIVVHICCKFVSPMFHMFFQTYVASVFIWMLHMFHTYVACFYLDVVYVCNDFQLFL